MVIWVCAISQTSDLRPEAHAPVFACSSSSFSPTVGQAVLGLIQGASPNSAPFRGRAMAGELDRETLISKYWVVGEHFSENSGRGMYPTVGEESFP